MWAIIGGSGFESFDGVEEVADIDRTTPFGEASTGLRRIRFNGQEIVFLSRHGRHHELLPSEVNYRANIYALKRAGVKKIISVSAVGSLRKELAPGDLVVATQYIDRTKGVRKHTYLGDGLVGHVSLAKPVWRKGVEAAKSVAEQMDFSIHFDKTYVCIEGPYFSTQAESNTYRQMGADIIGMTNFPEFALAREAGICYLPCCFVTDYDCWDDAIEHVTLQVVLDTMKQNNKKAVKMIGALLKENPDVETESREGGLRNSLMTPLTSLNPKTRGWLEVLTD
ncbi:MAG: MTAP family purine nucleoside phosphorylase [Bdellovibrionales bacterium]|jgi:5'-methylthioadenosine phosphorylase|nr:MTAP family purine nucleoside phosphorylase [Bdellovibrionales bacterium]